MLRLYAVTTRMKELLCVCVFVQKRKKFCWPPRRLSLQYKTAWMWTVVPRELASSLYNYSCWDPLSAQETRPGLSALHSINFSWAKFMSIFVKVIQFYHKVDQFFFLGSRKTSNKSNMSNLPLETLIATKILK